MGVCLGFEVGGAAALVIAHKILLLTSYTWTGILVGVVGSCTLLTGQWTMTSIKVTF